MGLMIRREAPHCATVENIPLWDAVGDGVAAELRALLAQTGVVVFRRQALSEPELVRVAGMFGAVEASLRYDWASLATREVGYISNLRDAEGRAIGGLGSNEVVWHSDQSYVANPATGAMLYCVEAPADAARTSWADLKAAHAALPAAVQARIADMVAVFSYEKRSVSYEQGSRPGADIRRQTPPVAHRLVNSQPLTGAKSLYLDPATAIGIHGMAADGGKLLDELADHATQPQFLYTHEWQIGDLVVWDNAVTLHRREPFDPRRPRLLKRLQMRLPHQEFICPD
jgi:taurine dioxygenase